MKRVLLVALSAMVCAAPLACTSDDDDDRLSRREDDRIISRGRAADADRYEDGRLARWPDSDSRVPAGAQIVGRMSNGNIAYEAREDGKLYLYDSTDRQVIWSGRIRDGEDFIFSPSRGTARLDDTPVNLPRLGAGHGFTLYFLEDER